MQAKKEIDMVMQSSTGSSIGEVIQANGVPLALIGVGIAWMLASNTGLTERVVNDERVQAARRRVGEIATDLGIAGKGEAGGTGRVLGPDGQPLTRTNGDGWVHQAADAAKGAISSVREAGNAVLDRAGDAGDFAKRAGGQVTEKLQGSDPWLIGIAGLVAGALFAALLPPSRIEREYAEEARDGLWNRATEFGHEAAERVRELADSTTASAKS
jgi:hypothetical protein